MYLVFQASRILLAESGRLHLPGVRPEGARDPHGGPLRLGFDPGSPVVVSWPDDLPPPPGTAFHGLRGALPLLESHEFQWAGRARQLLEWREQHRFCGRCGEQTVLADEGAALRCPRCGLSAFPRVSPAVIVLVHDGNRILLGRAPRFTPGMYSTLAGFVEPGESAEEAIHREVLEEAGVEVGELRYFGSQSWPFPHSLMIGFLARYRSGKIRVDERELEDVRWFTRDSLPVLPPASSIARRLIEAFLQRAAED